MKIKKNLTHDRCVCVKLHDDCEHVVIGVVSGFALPRHGDGDLVLGPGQVVLAVGAGAGAWDRGAGAGVLSAGGRVSGALRPEPVR